MSTLKELTWTAHKQAESSPLMTVLLENTITPELYCQLVYTKYEIYRAIEDRLVFQTPCLRRAQAALDDWQLMSGTIPNNLPSFDRYVDRLRLTSTYNLWAHAYVHYLAPLYGGQIIKRKIQDRFPVNLYQFDDPASAIAEIRSHITVDMADEANLAFSSTTSYYHELYQAHLTA